MRVLLATANEDLGQALSVFLEERSVDVAGVCADVRALPAVVVQTGPHVVLLDWRLGRNASAHAVEQVRSGTGTPVVVLCPPRDHEHATSCGAQAVATLGDPPPDLLALLEEVAGGEDGRGRATTR